MNLKFEELEVVEEMMSDFEKGFWEGLGMVGAAAIVVEIVITT